MELLSPSFIGKFTWWIVYLLGKTLTIEKRYSNEDYLWDRNQPCIYVLWHGRMFIPIFCFRNAGIYVLVSEHRDGDIITSSLESSGNKTVRGSTTRGGIRALAGLVRMGKQGKKIGFTPDGPRGPRWQFQPGAIYVAAKTGLPIVPLIGSAHQAHYFKSWDAFQLPLPFSRCVLTVGKPYYVTGGSDPQTIEYHRTELEKQLIKLTQEADELVGASGKE